MDMKKFQTHDKWSKEEHPRTQQREKLTTEAVRKFPKHDSTGYRKGYFEDENKSMKYSKPHSYQMERRPRSTSQAFVKTPKYEAIEKYDMEKISCSIDLANEQQDLNEANKGAKQSGHKENYKQIHEGVHPLCPNKGNEYPHSKYRAFKDIESSDTRMKLKKESSSVKDANIECFNIRKESNEISVNKENPSKNRDVKITYFSNENNLPPFQKRNTSSYESNQSFNYNNKQNKDRSNPFFHDLSKNVYMHEERATSESDNMHDSSQRAAFLNNSASYVNGGFNTFKLTDLLYYNTNLMQEHQLFEFASAVKSKILEKIDKFQNPEKEELEFLCEITDGDQSEKNQRIITTRTCYVVRNVIDKFPYLLNVIETPPPSQILVYQTVPNLHGVTNSYCSNYESPVFEIVQNTKMVLTSTEDYNMMAGIAQNDKYVSSKGTSDSLDIMNSNGYKDNCEVKNCKTNNAKNSSINTPLITEDEDIDAESSKYCYPTSANSGICTSVQNVSFDKESSIFHAFNLDNLLKYDVHVMHGNLVFDYGFSMKKRILENIDRFKDLYKEKLKFLCELTDGTQRVENQKLINARMVDLINDFDDEISDNYRQDLKKVSRNIHPFQSHYENEIVHEHRQNSDDQSRNTHTRKLHYKEESVYEHRQNSSDGQPRNVYLKRSHYKDETVHEYGKNFSDGQPNSVHLRRSHYKDEMVQNFSDRQSRNVHENLSHYKDEMVQNFSDRQSRNVHENPAHYKDEVVHEHRQNFSDGQPNSVHLRRSHYKDEMVQNFSDRQSRNVHENLSHYKDEVVHEHRQNFSDGQPNSVHLRRSHYKDEMVQNFSDRQSRNVHENLSHYKDEVVHEHRQNFSDGQPNSVHLRRSHYKDEMVQNFSDRQSRNVHENLSHYKDEVVHEHRQNFSDGQPNSVHLRRSHYKDEMVQNFSDRQSRNVHENLSHYKDEVVHEHRQNFSDGQPNSVHLRRSHYKDEMVQNFSDRQSRNVHENLSHYKDEVVHEHRQNFSDGQPNSVHLRRSHYKDEMVQNFSDRQSRNVHENLSHYKDEVVHEHRQNFSDGQSRNVHQKKLHYEDARRR